MCEIIGQLLSVGKHTRKADNSTYYSIKLLLTDDKVSIMFFSDDNLYDSLSKVERLSAVNFRCEIKYKDDRSFYLIPINFEM